MYKRPKDELVVEEARQAAAKMGQDLRSARQARSLIQETVAYRAGMSLATYKRMEAGDPAVGMGLWLRAWQQFGLLEQLVEATSPHQDVFGEQLRRVKSSIRVRRLSRRKEDWDY